MISKVKKEFLSDPLGYSWDSFLIFTFFVLHFLFPERVNIYIPVSMMILIPLRIQSPSINKIQNPPE